MNKQIRDQIDSLREKRSDIKNKLKRIDHMRNIELCDILLKHSLLIKKQIKFLNELHKLNKV